MPDALAIEGGAPIRKTLLPYGRQRVDDADILAVTEALRSDWLTTGPRVAEFEKAFTSFTGAREAVAVSSGTAALHAAMYALGIKQGDEVIVPTMTFAATANAVVFQGGTPIFADSEPGTLLIDPTDVEKKISKKTKAIVAVDYAGQPCDYDALRAIAKKHKLPLVADACHAIGAAYKGKSVGSLADLSCFSFHPVKPLATGEGGMITTDDPELALRMRRFRNHCLTSDHRERQEQGSWFYEMVDLGFNYRLTDIQCALGQSQLRRVPDWTKRRQTLAQKYDIAFKGMNDVVPLERQKGATHAFHIYVVRVAGDRAKIFAALRAENIGVNVHYIPVHLHPYYRKTFGTKPGLCPVAEKAYEQMITLPLFSGMSDADADDVIAAVKKVIAAYA